MLWYYFHVQGLVVTRVVWDWKTGTGTGCLGTGAVARSALGREVAWSYQVPKSCGAVKRSLGVLKIPRCAWKPGAERLHKGNGTEENDLPKQSNKLTDHFPDQAKTCLRRGSTLTPCCGCEVCAPTETCFQQPFLRGAVRANFVHQDCLFCLSKLLAVSGRK